MNAPGQLYLVSVGPGFSSGRARQSSAWELWWGALRCSTTLVEPGSKNRSQVKKPVSIGFLRLKLLAAAAPVTSTT